MTQLLFVKKGEIFFFMGGDKDKSKISNTEMENLSLETSSRYPRDFLTRFSGWREGEFGAIKEEGYEEDDHEIELNLGLSLGGRLGVDKGGSMKLIRSSSIAECLPIVKDEDDDALTCSSSPPAVAAYTRLVRTTSLPLGGSGGGAGGDEELRKRKELQTLRRMEAKKRRSEKQRNLKGEREEGGGSGSQLQEEKRDSNIDLNLRTRLEKDRVFEAAKRLNSWVAPPFGSPSRAAETVPQGGVGGGGGGGGVVAKGKGMQEFVESQGGSSSEMDSRLLPRTTGSGGSSSPGNIQSSTMQESSSNQDVGCSSGTKTRDQTLGRTSSLGVENPSRQSDATTRSSSNIQARETRANALEDMPCVFTKGDGPNGRRVDGILYKYGRGEEVRIMCVCHGSFHSPAEFVKHAGGTDITHPLKHIVVNPNTTPFT